MSNTPHKSNGNVHRLPHAASANARYEIVFESRARLKPSLEAAWGELKALGVRGGTAFDGAYARLAGSFLDWFERMEDGNAERKFQQRAERKRTR